MQFWPFRISVSDADPGGLFRPDLSPSGRFKVLLDALMLAPSAVYRGTTYTLYDVEYIDGVIVGRIAHPADVDRALPDDKQPGRLLDFREPSNAWTHFVFFGVGEHAMGVRRKQEFFSGDPDGMAEILKALLLAGLRNAQYEIAVYPIARSGSFWSVLERLSQLKRIDFEFVAPNMFGGRQNLAPLLEIQRTYHNANIFRAGVESESGNLNFPRNEQTEGEVDYAEAGGGKWSIEGRDAAGERVSVRSDRDTTIVLDVVDDEESRVSIRHRVSEIVRKISSFL